jgi:peroxiredoxin
MRMIKRRTLVAGMTATAGGLDWFAGTRQASASEPPGTQMGQRFPDIIYHTEDGQKHSVSDAAGKVVMVYMWAVWCPICFNDISNIQYLYTKYQSNPQFSTVGLNFMDLYGPAVTWARERRGVTFPLGDCGIPSRVSTLATTTSGQFMLPRLTPQFYLLDRSGVIAYKTEGHPNSNFPAVTAKIDALLSGSAQHS